MSKTRPKVHTECMVKAWPRVWLGDVATYINGFAFKPTDWGERGRPIIRIQDLTGTGAGAHRFDGVIDEKYRVSKGDVLVSWSASLDAFIWDGEDAWLNQHIFKVRFDKAEVDVGYFYHQVRYLLATLRLNLHGATMRHLTKPNFDALPFVLPPLAEQKKIVEKVEKALKRVDALKAQFERMEKSAAEYFKAALAETFAAVKGEKVKLGDVCDVRDGTHDSPRPSLNGYPLVTSKNIKGGILSLEKTYLISEADYEAINKRSKVDVYDVLFSMIGTVGEVAVIREEPRFAIKNVGLIKTKGDAGLADFLFYYLKSEPCRRSFENQLKGSNQKFLALGLLREIEIPKDCLDRARQISSDLDAAKAKSERMVAAARRGIEICGKMRKAILAEAFQ